VEVLAHLVFPDSLADRDADLAGPGQGAAGDPVGDAGEQFVGRGQQVARLRARSAASAGLRQAINRSPG
jgi:hypothetical protein